jgi:hypothetical protein
LLLNRQANQTVFSYYVDMIKRKEAFFGGGTQRQLFRERGGSIFPYATRRHARKDASATSSSSGGSRDTQAYLEHCRELCGGDEEKLANLQKVEGLVLQHCGEDSIYTVNRRHFFKSSLYNVVDGD